MKSVRGRSLALESLGRGQPATGGSWYPLYLPNLGEVKLTGPLALIIILSMPETPPARHHMERNSVARDSQLHERAG